MTGQATGVAPLRGLVDDPRRACRTVDQDGFFARDEERFAPAAHRLAATARDYCRTCPLRRACDEYADTNRQQGVWGGKLRYIGDSGRITVLDLLGDLSHVVDKAPRRPRCTDPTHNNRKDASGRRRCRTCATQRQRERDKARSDAFREAS